VFSKMKRLTRAKRVAEYRAFCAHVAVCGITP